MQQTVIPVVERFLAGLNLSFPQDAAAEVFQDYAANFDDPAAALNSLTAEDLQIFAARIERRVYLDGKI